ncbi:MAG: PAS domain S-box protein [Candidatus Odinarchaeota archaeon]
MPEPTLQHRFQNLAKAADVLIIGTNARGKITFFNRKCEQVTGYTQDEVFGKSVFTSLISKKDRVEVRKMFKRLAVGEVSPDSSEVALITKDGNQLVTQWRYSLIYDEKGTVIEIFGIGLDITEQKITENILHESEARFRLLAENALDSIYLFSLHPKRKFEYVSPATTQMTGYAVEEFYADPDFVIKIIHPDDLSSLQSMLADPAAFTTPSELRWVKKDGSVLWTEQRSRLIHDDDGNLVAVYGVVRDITGRKQATDDMQRARNLAEFLVDLMAHDLNNINQGILSALEILLHDPGFPEQLEGRLKDAIAQVERSAYLIDSVKRFQRIDVEPLQLKLVDPFAPLQSAIWAAERAHPAKQLFVTSNIRKGQYQVLADRFLSELFFNILHNAAKYDHSDRVTIDVRANKMRNKRSLQIQIMDHGPGIPDEEKERIFSRLASRRTGVKGSGIGLTLVNQILQRYGGSISITDRVEGDHTQGANFVILIPLKE